jgi:hypothetical protein
VKRNIFHVIFVAVAGILLSGCGGAGGGGSSTPSTGTASMKITDAKPYLPASGVENVSITFDEVSVHKSGGAWVRLATAQQPYTVDLYQFSDGTTTQFVPPVQLESGKYTQVRIGVTSGTIRIAGVDHPLEIPSENLKTDKNFEFTVQGGGAVDLTVDFDLSQSILLTGSGTYQLKPVLHVVTTTEAWTIRGNILSSSFGTPAQDAVVVVYRDSNANGAFERGVDEEYTRLRVQKGNSHQTEFSVFWLVPDENYNVEVYLGEPEDTPDPEYSEFVNKSGWTSKTFSLNGGDAFSIAD